MNGVRASAAVRRWLSLARPGGRGRRDRLRGDAGRAQGPGGHAALGVPRYRQVLRLAETMDEAIRYQFETRHGDDAETGPASLAGPSRDLADVLYEKRPVQLPLDLTDGDKVRILCTGAYTTSWPRSASTVSQPLRAVSSADAHVGAWGQPSHAPDRGHRKDPDARRPGHRPHVSLPARGSSAVMIRRRRCGRWVARLVALRPRPISCSSPAT